MKPKPEAKAAFLVALFCAAAIFLGCGHDHNSFYPTLADADNDGETTHGWIPDFLPKTSRNIHEAHDLSPEDEWCAFEFDPADSATLRQALKPLGDLHDREIPNPRVSWWPRLLTGNVSVDKIQPSGLQLYLFTRQADAVQTAAYTFVIDWNKAQGYFFTR